MTIKINHLTSPPILAVLLYCCFDQNQSKMLKNLFLSVLNNPNNQISVGKKINELTVMGGGGSKGGKSMLTVLMFFLRIF